MKIYLILAGNAISGYSYDSLPNTIEVEIADPKSIKLGTDTYENGQIVSKLKDASVLKVERILELKKLLLSTDYIALKHADGELTDEEYAETKAKRHAWRLEINELEAE